MNALVYVDIDQGIQKVKIHEITMLSIEDMDKDETDLELF